MSDNPVEPDSLNQLGIDTVIVAGADMQDGCSARG
jgi:hypothetical protein